MAVSGAYEITPALAMGTTSLTAAFRPTMQARQRCSPDAFSTSSRRESTAGGRPPAR